MRKRSIVTITAIAAAMFALAGCASTGAPSSAPSSTTRQVGSSSSQAALLSTESTSLGKIVTDGSGNTAYLFTSDKPGSGKSTCYGGCAALWPAVTTGTTHPTVKGITGKIGTITRTDGTKQVTVNGWPMYRFANDTAPGQVNGQGLTHAWYALTPAGTKITTAAASGSSSSPSTPSTSGSSSKSSSSSTGSSGSSSDSSWG